LLPDPHPRDPITFDFIAFSFIAFGLIILGLVAFGFIAFGFVAFGFIDFALVLQHSLAVAGLGEVLTSRICRLVRSRSSPRSTDHLALGILQQVILLSPWSPSHFNFSDCA
jgi:hypothetical protein